MSENNQKDINNEGTIAEDANSTNSSDNLDVLENIDNSIKLEILSPSDKKNDPRVQKYLKHLKDAIDNADVKNLALSGVYGSGKSTIIKSFKSLYPNFKVLNISLASFNESDKYDEFKEQIQLNILQQIIYSQKADKFPESRINRINEIDTLSKDNKISILSFLGLLISLYLLLNFYKFQLNPNNLYLSESCENIISNISVSFFILLATFTVSLFYLGQSFFKIAINSKINKISLSGEAEIENKNDKKDVLNKYIDEIIYFFEKVSVDVVIIEDLDRFNTTEIYRTLREINFILNTYIENLKNENFKKITFLYAIKDDLFTNELDRTKFFDLIIPAIPFVNYSNSKNVLSDKLDNIFKDEKFFVKPSKEFINTVSSFITDNRTLLNIINEFVVYKEQQKLEVEELNPEKLLALIIYKNLRPNDFSRLHECKSNIDVMFSYKEKLIQSLIKDIDKSIKVCEGKIETIKVENINSIRELNTIYLYHIKEKIGTKNAKGLIYKSEKQTFEQIINNALDLNVFYNDEIEYYDIYSNYSLSYKLNNIDKIKDGYSYSEKYDLILNKDKNILKNENEIKGFRRKLDDLNSWTLKQILDNKKLNKKELKNEFIEYYAEMKIEESDKLYNDPLLIFLLHNGYLDEHYREYISIFQKGGLKEADQEFKINIISLINEPKSFSYELDNPEDIIDELPINYFRDNRIFNIDLVNFITINKTKYEDKFQAVLDTIADWSSKRTKQFLSTYLYDGNQNKEFILELAKSWNEFWEIIMKDPSFIEDDKKQILYFLLKYSDNITLKTLNRNKELSNYISQNINILDDFNNEQSIERIQNILSEEVLNVKFKELKPFPDNSNDIFNIIYENSRYEITNNNLGTILEEKLQDEFYLEKFNNYNLSYLYEIKLDKITDYLESENYDSYIDNVYSKLENTQDDEKGIILNVLNSEKLDLDKKILFLKKQVKKISDITSLKTIELYDLVINESKVEATWENVYDYYYVYDNIFNENLTSFLSSKENYSDLSLESKINIDKEVEEEFVLKLISNNELTMDSYTILMNCLPQEYVFKDEFDFGLIDKNKVEKLIELNIVPLNEINFENIKIKYPNLHIRLLLRDWDEYLKFYEENDIDIEDEILILNYVKLNDNLKFYILKNQVSENDLKNKNLGLLVAELILKHSSIPNGTINSSKLKILFSHNLTTENKIKLINLFKDILTKNDILEMQVYLPKQYQVHPKSQLMLKNNDLNSNFVTVLKKVKIAGESKNTKNNEIRVWLNNF